DDRVFVDGDDERAASLIDAHVGEQAGSEQALHSLVDVVVIEIPAGTDRDVAADRLRIDTAVAADFDPVDHGGFCDGHGCQLQCACAAHHNAGRDSDRRNGAEQIRSCLHWALKPFILVVPTARTPDVAVTSVVPYYPDFAYTQGFWLRSIYLITGRGISVTGKPRHGKCAVNFISKPIILFIFQQPNRSFQNTNIMKPSTTNSPAR